MANEKRLIDANALDEKLEILKVRFKAQGRNTVAEDYNFVQTVLMTAPTVDAVEVVRCKDCKNCNDVSAIPHIADSLKLVCMKGVNWRAVDPNHFCSYRERRTDEKAERT